MDPLATLQQVGTMASVTSQSGLPVSLTNSLPGAPGSPAKAFPPLGNPVGQLTQPFNQVNLASQLQSKYAVFLCGCRVVVIDLYMVPRELELILIGLVHCITCT